MVTYTPAIQAQVRDLLGIPDDQYILELTMNVAGVRIVTLARDPVTGEHFQTIGGIPGTAVYYVPTTEG